MPLEVQHDEKLEVALARTSLFGGLPPEDLATLAGRGERQSFAPGSVLMHQGDPSDNLHVVLIGRIRVNRSHPELDGDIVLAELGPSDIVGEMGVVDGSPRSATVIALADTETFALSSDVLSQTLVQFPQVALALMRLVTTRLRSTNDLMERMARWGGEIAVARSRWEERFFADARTARALMQLASEHLEEADTEYGTPWRTTTYCDTDDFAFYRAAEAGDSTSMRFREYHARRPKPAFTNPTVWLEMKETATLGDKYRLEVPTATIPEWLHDSQTRLSSLGWMTPEDEPTRPDVRPVLVTQCYRVAYASPGETLRMNADFGLTYSTLQWPENGESALPCERTLLSYERGVVIEVKWTDRLPDWAANAIQDLRTTSPDLRPPKFVAGMRLLAQKPGTRLAAAAISGLLGPDGEEYGSLLSLMEDVMPEKPSPTVLVVDDEPYILRALEYLFQREGYHVATATNGVDGLSRIRELRPPIVFLDVMMPFMDGYEVCEQVKGDAELAGTYVIMLSARGQHLDRERGMNSGADEFMSKPFSPKVVADRVRALVAERSIAP